MTKAITHFGLIKYAIAGASEVAHIPSLAYRVGESVGNIFYSPKIRKALGLGAGIGGVAAGSGVIGHELGERDGTDKGLHMGYNAGRSQAENALSKQDLWDRIKGIFAGNKDVVSKLPRPTPYMAKSSYNTGMMNGQPIRPQNPLTIGMYDPSNGQNFDRVFNAKPQSNQNQIPFMHRLMNPFMWADGGAQERSAWDPHKHGILERLGHNFKDTYTYHTNPQGLADRLHNFTLM